MNYRVRVLGRKVIITISVGSVTVTIELPKRRGRSAFEEHSAFGPQYSRISPFFTPAKSL